METEKNELTYSQAIARLQQIVSQIDNGELEVDQLADSLRQANDLIAFCKGKLTRAEEEVKKISPDSQPDE